MSAGNRRAMPAAADNTVPDLEARLAQYPSTRYPVQHATAAFHLGTAYLHRGDVEQARELLDTSHDLFARVGMVLEQAKAQMMCGVALREAGDLENALIRLTDAADTFDESGEHAEQGAAAYNLSVVLTAMGRPSAALTAMARAAALLESSGQLPQAAAAYREQGAALLRTDHADQAVPLLEHGADLARRAGDLAGLGAASNVLGLARLALEDTRGAVVALTEAVGAYPRSLRPHEHAMAKANLALAYHHDADPARARLVARQVSNLPDLDPQVAAQVREVLVGSPDADGPDLFSVLDREDPDRWPAIIREETARWSLGGPSERARGVSEFIGGLLERPAESHAWAASLLSVILELPPEDFNEMVHEVAHATSRLADEESRARVRTVFASALVRFAMPQWQRTVAALNAASADLGEKAQWR